MERTDPAAAGAAIAGDPTLAGAVVTITLVYSSTTALGSAPACYADGNGTSIVVMN